VLICSWRKVLLATASGGCLPSYHVAVNYSTRINYLSHQSSDTNYEY
jgi:hypothetical protein